MVSPPANLPLRLGVTNPAPAGASPTVRREPVVANAAPAATPEQLAAQCQAGSAEAFSALVASFQERIFNYLLQLTGCRQDAEDLAQETFLKAYLGLPRYAPRYSFATWLFTIAKRAAISHFRAARAPEPLPEDDRLVSTEADPATGLAQRDALASLWQVARRLKPKQFEALWLRYGEGFSVAEVARVMATNQIHVKVLLHRARSALAKRLQASDMI